jgi:hypothetical protein
MFRTEEVKTEKIENKYVGVVCDKCNEDIIDWHGYEKYYEITLIANQTYPEDWWCYKAQLCPKCMERLTKDWLLRYEEK